MDAKTLAHRLGCCAMSENGPGYWDIGHAEALISSALSAQAAEVERLKDDARVKEWARWEKAISSCRHLHPDGTDGGAHISCWEIRNLIGSIPESVRNLLPPDAPEPTP